MVSACSDTPLFPSFDEERSFTTHREIDVRWTNEGTTIAGTIYLPQGPGPFPGLAMHFGSGEWSRGTFEEVGVLVTDFDIAVITYDKRGVGESEGECCPEDFPLLAADLAAGVRALAERPEVDRSRIGLFGSSQGSWIAPIAAAELEPDLVAYLMLSVGGAVTVGEQNLYARLTGFDGCVATGADPADIEAQVQAAGPSGFDPAPFLRRMRQPAVWLFGETDASTPTARSLARLKALRAELGKDWEFVVFEDANHNLIVDGSICQTEGERADFVQVLNDWFERMLGRSRP